MPPTHIQINPRLAWSRRISYWLRFLPLIILVFTGWGWTAGAEPTDPSAGGTITVAESPDFASLVLRDPWDMEQYSDVSQYLNESGERNLVTNVEMNNGQFLGTSVGDVLSGNAYFFPLFPGYETATLIGKVGHRYPIETASYRCLHLAMQVESGPANGFGPDQFRIFWFQDERLNTINTWGVTNGIALYPETPGFNQPIWSWRLYTIDLANPPSGLVPGRTPWNNLSQWQGIRIDPTINAGVDFAVDWVRLTPCSPAFQQITWGAGSVQSVWVRPAGTSRDIRVDADTGGISSPYNLDTKGLPPGQYTIRLSTDITSCCSAVANETLVVNQTPIVKFSRPSTLSGQDYATQAGNPWDFSDSTDVTRIENVTATWVPGALDLVTASGGLPGGIDAQLDLNTPTAFDPNEYRYLNIRMFTEAPWQFIAQGMIGRWIWSIPSLAGGGLRCDLVSQDIPYDVDWYTITLDMMDSFEGTVEITSPGGPPHCPSLPLNWYSAGPIIKTRWDPNENITGFAIHQILDWIRLTKVEQARQNAVFPVQIDLNVPVGNLQTLTFYYTTNLNQPTQNVAQEYNPPPPPSWPFDVFLPVMRHGGDPFLQTLPVDLTFQWDTSGVSQGMYYICAWADDGINDATYCSEAPVEITS